jgi:SAM-dependent methyltransferase
MAEYLDTEAETYRERRDMLLKEVDAATIRKAWFTLSHLLLEDGAKVVDMGCDDGAMTYAMAAMSPKLRFTGLDKNKRQINKAKEKYKLFNLDFKIGDASSEIFEEESVDAIINSYVLHEVYSGQRYNEAIVTDTLTKHFKSLKKGGVMFIRDYARPPPEEFVLMEMPDLPSKGNDLAHLSEADLLVWYAEHARPRQDAGCGGFFLEELPERFPRTRLFRLPYKWAYEFIMRKDDRTHWETELPMEYTFFTMHDFRRQLRALGSRVQYSGPYWDDDIINEKFEGRFRLYQDNGQSLGHPPTCFIAVAYKMAERKSLHIEERRPSVVDSGNLKISAMRNQHTGEIVDVVSRDLDLSEILPYRIDEEGRLKIYLHDGIARSITNAVPRGGMNIDGRRWSGHMVEPIVVDGEAMASVREFDRKHTVLFCRDYIGLKPRDGFVLEKGPHYYPAPDYIDEKIQTFYLQVEEARGAIMPKTTIGAEKFQAKGMIREVDAQQVLNAVTVGMIPNARLELQILSLFQHLNIKAETWTDKQLNLNISKINEKISIKSILDLMKDKDDRFKEIKGTSGQLRPVHSTFVEEGQSRGSMSGLSSENVDFIVHDGKTVNTAVVLPMTKDLKGAVHAGVLVNYLPVPQRHEGNGLTVSAPSFNIPSEVTNFTALRKFIADEFGVPPQKVLKLGESYFSHVGMTPHRIYPFIVASPAEAMKYSQAKFLPFYQLRILMRLISKEPHFMMAIARAYRYYHEELRLDAKLQVKEIVRQRFEGLNPDWSIPISFESLESLRTKKRVEDVPETPKLEIKKPLAAPTKGPSKIKAFHMQGHEPSPEPQQTPAPAVKPETVLPDYSKEEVTEYEAEIEAFMDVIENEAAPRPEKW